MPATISVGPSSTVDDSNAKGAKRRLRSTCLSLRRGWKAWCGAAALAALVAVASLSRDRVPIGHLDAARAYYDRRDVLVSRWAEAPRLSPFAAAPPPTFSPEAKTELGRWVNYDDEAAPQQCVAVDDAPLVWALKTPKAASSTLQDVILGLASEHPGRFVVNTRQLRVDPTKIPAQRSLMLQRYAE